MTFIVMGNIVKVELNTCQVYDMMGGETHLIHINGESILDLKPGMDGIFIGDCVHGKLKAKKVEISKFLNALYEEDLFDSSGAWTLVQVVDDPFPEIFKKYMEEQKLLEVEHYKADALVDLDLEDIEDFESYEEDEDEPDE